MRINALRANYDLKLLLIHFILFLDLIGTTQKQKTTTTKTENVETVFRDRETNALEKKWL